jgi:hypothetical protein
MTLDELRSLDPRNIGSWPISVKLVTLLLLLVLVIFLGYWFDWRNQLSEINSLRERESKLRTAFVDKKRQAVNLPAYQKQLEDIEQAFGPVYAPPPVYVTLEGGLRAGMRFGFGYDTHGLRTFAESVQEGNANPLLLFDGFYVADTYNVNGQWKDLPELFLEAHIGAGVRVSAVILSIEVEGGIYAQLGLNLHDTDSDGKMRFGEFLDRIQMGGPLCIFDFQGEFGAYLELEVRFGLDLGLVCICVTFPFEIARVTLVSFEATT